MNKGTQNALLYTAGLAAVYLGYKYYKKQQGDKNQAPDTTEQAPVVKTKTPIVAANKPKVVTPIVAANKPKVVAPVKPTAASIAAAQKTANAINKGGVVRFLVDVKSNALVKSKLGTFVGIGSGLSFTKGQILGKGWIASNRANSSNIVITKDGRTFYEIPFNSIVVI